MLFSLHSSPPPSRRCLILNEKPLLLQDGTGSQVEFVVAKHHAISPWVTVYS
jgi:hypothetical protein